MSLVDWLSDTVGGSGCAIQIEPAAQEVGNWVEIRLFISSTFVDTHAERDVLVKRVIPSINRKLAKRFIRVVPVDLRWGVLAEESKDCKTIQKTCLNQVDKCRQSLRETPWFLGIRTERYGWVQNQVMASEGFENPDLYSWIDELRSSEKNGLSITSLECIHASQTTPDVNPSPTVFFYGRYIDEKDIRGDEIEKNMRWVFDFEYVQPDDALEADVKFQYAKTEMAQLYDGDKGGLNEFLKTLPHVKWTNYKCLYRHGGARYTCKREGAKSFGVGYVSFLEEFQSQVEEDLLDAIEENFRADDASGINSFQMETVQHENMIKLKSATFVGRTKLVAQCVDHCSASSGENTMILHGEPGCGKSGLLAAVTNKFVKDSRDSGNFVFVHVVDSCPGSSILEKMLRRLQTNLRAFRRSNGEINIPSSAPLIGSDLKNSHHQFIEETARKYPEKLFIFVVDAVNQFHDSMQAWNMWWLPRTSFPENIRFIISTLNSENSTFDNALETCPEAVRVPIGTMSGDDLEGMISTRLQKFNKKLTTYDDKLLGNQMELLLSKNTSPLYLIACCEALRKFGIFERVSQYIKSLPPTISELFSFLLDEWSEEYGQMFVHDVTGLICISKDGLLENEINDLLSFKETREQIEDDALLYDCSFSRIYDSLCSFLAAGGGGYLRFFHDQLKYTVREKFLTADFELETHRWLADFFYDVTLVQLCEDPAEEPPAYYDHVLQQLVYHQLKATPQGDKLERIGKTLRNVYFVRERVVRQQQQALIDEYEDAIKRCSEEDENEEVALALTAWAKFVQLYAPSIMQFPKFCHNMAMTQAPSSWVTKDTKTLPTPAQTSTGLGYPLKWANIPETEDAMVAKYNMGGTDCDASIPSGDVTALSSSDGLILYDQSSGEILHKLPGSSVSVSLSRDFESVYSGGSDGKVRVWDVSSGTLVGESAEPLNGPIVWIEHIDDFIACGTGHERFMICWDDHNISGNIAIFSMDGKTTIKSWLVNEPTFHYCYLASLKIIFSANKGGTIYGFDLDGNHLKTFNGAGGCVYSISAHPTKPRILSGSNDHVIREWDCVGDKLSRSIKDTTSSGWHFGGNWSVCYDMTGDRVLSTEPQSKSLRIYEFSGVLIEEIKGHLECINRIRIVPGGGNRAISTDRGGNTILWNLPDPIKGRAKSAQITSDKVQWCGFSPDETYFATVSDTHVRLWVSQTHQLQTSKEYEGFYRSKGAFSPDGEWLYASGRMNVTRFGVHDNLKAGGQMSVLNDPDGSLSDFAISSDGAILLGAECKNQNSDDSIAPVFDITEFSAPVEKLTYRECHARLFACDIHPDGLRGAVAGHSGTRIFNMETGETLLTVQRGCFWVKFLSGSEQICYADGNSVYLCNNGNDEDVMSYTGHTDGVTHATFIRNESNIYTASEDGVIRLFDVATGDCLYAFCNHRAEQYTSIAATDAGGLLVAGNNNGMVYVLKSGEQ